MYPCVHERATTPCRLSLRATARSGNRLYITCLHAYVPHVHVTTSRHPLKYIYPHVHVTTSRHPPPFFSLFAGNGAVGHRVRGQLVQGEPEGRRGSALRRGDRDRPRQATPPRERALHARPRAPRRSRVLVCRQGQLVEWLVWFRGGGGGGWALLHFRQGRGRGQTMHLVVMLVLSWLWLLTLVRVGGWWRVVRDGPPI